MVGESYSLGGAIRENVYDRGNINHRPSRHGGRHICLFDSYEAVKGPYFFALLDQLMGETQHETKNLAYFTSRSDLPANEGARVARGDRGDVLETLRASLDLDTATLFLLDDWNPPTLDEELSCSKPTIVWVQGKNAFHTRHLLRTSGLDRWLQEHCAPSHDQGSSSNNKGCAIPFIGEGAGALCSGSTMAIAHVRGDDPKMSPELQMYGLDLLGDDDDDSLVSFGVEEKILQGHPRTSDFVSNIQICRNDQIFVWSQSPNQETATRFVMTPKQRGTIEGYTTPDPWSDRQRRSRLGQADGGGVACHGEPAIDPSRSIQHIGDSEWMEEYIQ